MKTHLIIPDSHAHFKHHNLRAVWLGELIADVKPDTVIHIGDSADMPSLSGYEKGKKSFQGRTYRADIDAHLDFQDKMWERVRRRKKEMPFRAFFHGNHEYRINRALDMQPELEGAIGLHDLNLKDWYDLIVEYEGNTPGMYTLDGITYAHYFISGIQGRPLGGEHPAHSLLSKQFTSSVAGHNHMAEWVTRVTAEGRRIHGLNIGCYQDYDSDWAGEVNRLWWRGVVILRNVENGDFDPAFVSLKRLKDEYGYITR